MEKNLKRQIAKKISIYNILKSEYVKKDGWEPSYILCGKEKMTRLNIMGFVILRDNSKIVIDDGTANIDIRLFSESQNISVKQGDIAHIIGKPRHWNNQIYVVPEIIKKIVNKDWFLLWKEETSTEIIKITIKKENINKKEEPVVVFDEKPVKNPTQQIIDTIFSLDLGDGADIEKVINISKISNAEIIISSLMREGEIFQISPGKVKILD